MDRLETGGDLGGQVAQERFWKDLQARHQVAQGLSLDILLDEEVVGGGTDRDRIGIVGADDRGMLEGLADLGLA